MATYTRKVSIPFDGPDGYVENGTVTFEPTFYWDDVQFDEDNFVVRVGGKVIEQTVEQSANILDQLHGMSHDIMRERDRDMAEYRAEMAHYR